jgi:hypothetical protein
MLTNRNAFVTMFRPGFGGNVTVYFTPGVVHCTIISFGSLPTACQTSFIRRQVSLEDQRSVS